MTNQREGEPRVSQAIKWIALLSLITVIAGLVSLWAMGEWSFHGVVATVLGLFLSTLLGAGLFSLAFFSDKSGHDDDVTDATRRRR